MKQYCFASFCFFLLIACHPKREEPRLVYPITKKVDVTDEYPGAKIADPYRWLENDTSAETAAWVDTQNSVTFSYLSKIPYRDKLKQHLTEIFNYPRYSSPSRAGKYYFFNKNDGLQNQSVIYYQEGLEGEPKVFIDPNALSPDGTISVSLGDFSHDSDMRHIL